jgi:hypothetical protein
LIEGLALNNRGKEAEFSGYRSSGRVNLSGAARTKRVTDVDYSYGHTVFIHQMERFPSQRHGK